VYDHDTERAFTEPLIRPRLSPTNASAQSVPVSRVERTVSIGFQGDRLTVD
jgi:hypothetical protein